MSNSTARKAVFTARFNRALKRYAGKDRKRQKCIQETINRMMADLFDSRLRTHPLSGDLAGYMASSCGYDCRVVFSLERVQDGERILLVDVGTHRDVY